MLGAETRRNPYPALCALLLLTVLWSGAASTARALEVHAITQDGAAPPQGALVHLYQELEVAIHHQVAATRTAFQFRNDHTEELELSCAFALAPGEMVDGFSYWNGEEQITGEVLEKQTAAEVYQELTGVRRDPGIVEQEGNRFRFRVYPVQAGETKPVELRTVTPLRMREGWVQYTIPEQNLPSKGAIFSLKVDITDDLPIRNLEIPGVRARIQKFGPRHQRVVFERQGGAFKGDLNIRYQLAADDYALRFAVHRDGSADGSFMLMISPKESVRQDDVIGRDIVFVTDISGSMHGEPLQQTKLGLGYMLDRLSATDRFDVISFDDDSYPLFGALVRADRKHVKAAREAISLLQTKGGTNIRGALAAALDRLGESQPGRPRAVIFLTDGQGGAPPEQALAEVGDRSNGIRIYSFGAGNGVNRWFLERLAEDNRGIATFVQSSRHIKTEMKRLYDRISMPLMVDLDLDFEGLEVHSVYPKSLPDLYRDNEVVVLGRYKRSGSGRVRVTGRLKDREKTLSLDIQLPAASEEHATVEKLWASRRVQHLLSMMNLRGQDAEVIQEVTRLGIVYNLVTPYTSFLAVPASLQTDRIKGLIRQGKRGYDQKLIDSMKDVRLSQTHIPPGDPVLTVRAPENARKVVAYFPFGLVKRLQWDELRKRWHVRFLVPRDVPDGIYTIRIQIVHADGKSSWKSVQYAIDGTAPEFETTLSEFAEPGVPLVVEVDPLEPVAEVYAYLPGVDPKRVHLKLDLDTQTYIGELPIPEDFDADLVTVRVVVRDLARNRFQKNYNLEVVPFGDECGCDDPAEQDF